MGVFHPASCVYKRASDKELKRPDSAVTPFTNMD